MTLEEAQKIADEAIIAGLRGALPQNLGGIKPLRKLLTIAILQGGEVSAALVKGSALISHAGLSEGAIRASLQESLAQ